MSAAGRPRFATLSTSVDAARRTWLVLRERYGNWAFLPFVLLLLMAAVFGFLAAIPILAPFLYPLF
jgi:hypothetical protein